VRHIWADEQLDPDESLWRYFTLERLLEILRTGELHLASARQFEDRFEWAVAVDPRHQDLEDSERAFEQLRRLTKISSWHRADYESDAMWKLYASQRKGLAIRTSVQRLGAALQSFRLAAHFGEEEPYWGNVQRQKSEPEHATERIYVAFQANVCARRDKSRNKSRDTPLGPVVQSPVSCRPANSGQGGN
jgi:hypothetical protein